MPGLLDKNMTKKKGGDGQDAPPPKKNPVTTKIDGELLRLAKIIATYENVDLYAYLDSLIRGPITERSRQIIRDPEGE